ncbi:MAG: PAS domain S-box protein, partial [Rhizobacter sp.]
MVRLPHPIRRWLSRALVVASRARRLWPSARGRQVGELTQALVLASATLEAQLAELKKTEERTRLILGSVPDAIICLDDAGRIFLVSPAAASVFGLDSDALAQVSLSDCLPGLDREDIERRTMDGLYMRASGMHLARFEAVARRHGGTEFPADVSLTRIETSEGLRYTCIVRDITEQRMAVSMLNLYSRALECTTNGVVISDMSMPGRPVFYANPAFQRITGYEPGEAIGRNCAFLQRDDNRQPEIDVLRDAVSRGQSCSVVLRNYRKDGALFFNELSVAPVIGLEGEVAHYVGVLNDVTERERARMAIAERSARLNAVFDLSPDGFVVFNEAGQLVYSNRAFLGMTGWLPADSAPLIDVQEFDCRFSRLCDPERQARSLTEALAHPGETPDTLHLIHPEHRVLVRDVRGQIDGTGEIIVFLRDVTRESEVDRMKSEFLTTAAHELRTPMVSVFGFTELLLNRPVPEGRRRDMLETIHRQSQLLINMVNELLDLARIEARQGKDLKRELCRLRVFVDQGMAPFQEAAGSRTSFLDMSHSEALLHVDIEKAQRAF